MTIDPRRALRAGAFLAWAGFFVYLWLSGHAFDYVGRRTAWVVPFGAVVLSITAVGYLFTVRVPRPSRRPSLADIAAAAAFVAPLLVVFMVPSPTLGALAADRKGAGGDARRALPPPNRAAGHTVSLLDLSWAASVPEFRASRGIRDGLPVTFTGLVSQASYEVITVTRFQITCCVADAIPYSIEVRGRAVGNSAGKDDWVRVHGTVDIEGSKLTVASQSVERIHEPDDPYSEY
jgi:uncharacterized repeat protein (TIGR03943 family)